LLYEAVLYNYYGINRDAIIIIILPGSVVLLHIPCMMLVLQILIYPVNMFIALFCLFRYEMCADSLAPNR